MIKLNCKQCGLEADIPETNMYQDVMQHLIQNHDFDNQGETVTQMIESFYREQELNEQFDKATKVLVAINKLLKEYF